MLAACGAWAVGYSGVPVLTDDLADSNLIVKGALWSVLLLPVVLELHGFAYLRTRTFSRDEGCLRVEDVPRTVARSLHIIRE